MSMNSVDKNKLTVAMTTFNRITMVNKIAIYFIMGIIAPLLMFCWSVGFIEALKSLLCLITKLLQCCWTSRFVILLLNMGILVHVTKWGFLYHFNMTEQDLYAGFLKKNENRFKCYNYLLVASEEKSPSMDEAKLICKQIEENTCFEQALKQKPSETVKEPTNMIVMEDANEESVIDEELNRKVEAFILKFNRQMRLQRQESLKRHHQIMVE